MTQTSIISLSASVREAIDYALTHDPWLKSPRTVTQYRSHLHGFEAYRAGRTLTKSLVMDYAASLQKAGYAPRTVNQRLAAVRWWVRKLIDRADDHGELSEEDSRLASKVLTIRDVKGSRLPRGRYLSREEQSALLNACASDPSPAGARDSAMIAVALSVGLRRDDLTTLTLENIRNNTGESCDLVVHGKGDRVDTLYLYNGGYKRLMTWLTVRGQDSGRIFTPVLKNDKINTGGKLSGESLRKILDSRQIGLGLPEHITWHDLRKTFVCTLLDKGQDLATVQKVARHASPSTTSNIYDIRGEKVQRAAVQTLEIGE